MNTFNKKSLCVAIAATGLLGGAAQAVNLSENGTGNVLVYQYYTVRVSPGGNTYNTYINLTNSTASTKSVKVRFREGRNSAEGLDFNVFLSPWDMWTGAVIPTTDGAAVISYDKSCTLPSLKDSSGNPVALPFRNLRYSGTADDGGGTSLDRTREGYVEVFEMGDVTNLTATASAKQNSAGVPANCAYFETFNTNLASSGQGRHEEIHEHDSRHARELRDGADSRRGVPHGQP